MEAIVFAATFSLLAALVLLVGVTSTGIAKDHHGVDVATHEPVHGVCLFINVQRVCW